jgi:hypothetical protein
MNSLSMIRAHKAARVYAAASRAYKGFYSDYDGGVDFQRVRAVRAVAANERIETFSSTSGSHGQFHSPCLAG